MKISQFNCLTEKSDKLFDPLKIYKAWFHGIISK